MRHTIDINETLLAEVMKIMGTRTKSETVARALEAQVAFSRQVGTRQIKAKLDWQAHSNE